MRKAIVVSLDAFFSDDFSCLSSDGGIQSLLNNGCYCKNVKTVFPALTYPAHVTLITGADPVTTGIGQNQPFQPDIKEEMRAWYWDHRSIRIETLFDAVKRNGGKTSSVFWPVSGKNRNIRWNMPEVVALPGENQVKKILSFGTPLWMVSMEKKYGYIRKGIQEPGLSDFAIAVSENVIRNHAPEFTAVHLIDQDEMRHQYGTYSQEACQALNRNELRIERIWNSIVQTADMKDALLFVVSDHGQADITKTVSLKEVIHERQLSEKLDVQSNGMSAYFFNLGLSEKKLEEEIQYLNENKEKIGLSKVYTAEDLIRMNCVHGPCFAVEAADGIVFSDQLETKKREKATHGFGPGHKAENCLFAVRGKGIKKNYELPVMQMKDVAPTIAELMEIDLPQATGKSFANEILS